MTIDEIIARHDFGQPHAVMRREHWVPVIVHRTGRIEQIRGYGFATKEKAYLLAESAIVARRNLFKNQLGEMN